MDNFGLALKVEEKIKHFYYSVISFDQSYTVVPIEVAWIYLLLAKREGSDYSRKTFMFV